MKRKKFGVTRTARTVSPRSPTLSTIDWPCVPTTSSKAGAPANSANSSGASRFRLLPLGESIRTFTKRREPG